MFNELIVSGQTGEMARTHKPWSIGLSVILQAGILGALLLIPLIYTQVLPKTMLTTFLVAPPPPPPPPPPQQAVVKQVKPVKVIAVNKMAAPTVIPKKIEIAKDEAPPAVNPNDMPGVAGGTGDVLGGVGTGAAPAPPPPAAPKRIHVGGNVQAASLVNKVEPQYPAIAKTAHVSGTVVLHAIIAKDGSVEKLQFVSGPALLMASAMSAVKEWRYRPTMLNGQPVEVDTTVQVVFSLG
ncbi:MAG TPA: TonB family protein [Verrucomicrobiae bacterium]|nr:TonB family protein [Verrucomicrobiae bacterium]